MTVAIHLPISSKRNKRQPHSTQEKKKAFGTTLECYCPAYWYLYHYRYKAASDTNFYEKTGSIKFSSARRKGMSDLLPRRAGHVRPQPGRLNPGIQSQWLEGLFSRNILRIFEVPEEPIEKAEAPAHKASEKRAESAGKVESVRVQAYRLDELMDQLGELVIAQARLNRIAERMNDQSLGSAREAFHFSFSFSLKVGSKQPKL